MKPKTTIEEVFSYTFFMQQGTGTVPNKKKTRRIIGSSAYSKLHKRYHK